MAPLCVLYLVNSLPVACDSQLMFFFAEHCTVSVYQGTKSIIDTIYCYNNNNTALPIIRQIAQKRAYTLSH